MSQRYVVKTIAVMSTVLMVGLLAADVEARRGGGGGFSRAGAASGGSFSSRASASSARTASRQAGSVQRSGQRADTRQTRTQARADTRTSGQQERTERQGQRQEGRTARTESRQEGYTERTRARTDAARDIADDWDDHGCCWDDDRWGYALAGAAVGATVGYVAGAAVATPAYVTVLPCTPTITVMGGISYYRCGSTWYNRSYISGEVSYIVVDAPLGY
jgi:hypothetical protein